MIPAPLVIMPKGWTPATVRREWRDERGRHRVTYKRDDATGRIAGNDRGAGYEYNPPTTMGTAGIQHAVMRIPAVRVQLSASRFGLTVEQMRAVVARKFSAPNRPSSGLYLP